MDILKRLEQFITGYRLQTLFLLIFIFFQPFGKFAGVRNAAFVLMTLCFIIKALAGKIEINLRDRTVQAFGAIILVSIVSSLFSPYMMESFDYMRKNLLYQAILFLVIINEFKGFSDLKPFFYTVLASFAVVSIIIFSMNDFSDLMHWLDNPRLRHTRGYSLNATFYIPFAAAYLYAAKDNFRSKAMLVGLIAAELLLSVLNNHRSQIVAITAGVFIIIVLAKSYKVLLAGVVAAIIAAFLIVQANPKALDRYKTLVDADTYTSNEHQGWNNRLAIWRGTLDMVEKRPVLGYGYGWKKIETVAKTEGFVERWKNEGKTETYEYFDKHGYGSANPHNLALQILFEIGVLGLVAFVVFWLTVAARAVCAFRFKPSEGARFIKYSVLGVLLSYAIVNTSNGLWQESYGIMMTALAAIIVVLHREASGAPPEAR